MVFGESVFGESPFGEAVADGQVAGESFVAAATMLDGTLNVGINVDGEPFTAPATMLDGSIALSPIDIAGEPFAATATILDGTPLAGFDVAGEPFAAGAIALDGTTVVERIVPPADLILTATPQNRAGAQQIPPAELTLTAENPLIHRAILVTTRWTFYDPVLNETWTLPINPDSMTNPTKAKGLAFARNVRSGGRHTTIRQVPRPLEWEFAGVIRTQVQHDTLDEWAGRRRIIHVRDHLHRTFEVLLTSFDVTERTPTKTTKWRLRYSMKALLLRQLS